MTPLAIELAERGLVPLGGLRLGVRRLVKQRLREAAASSDTDAFVRELERSPVALSTDKANEQHYEVPPELFQIMLGPRLKYSGAYWPDGVDALGEAERAMLDLTCERARLEDGQDVLELGCGWGSLTLHMAEAYPNSRITAVSNSAPQRRFIEARAPGNVRVVTADMNDLDLSERFDRVVSVEMFEHMRNYRELLRRIRGWTRPDGRLFVHVFCHRVHAYPYETEGADNWMGRYFFTGGIMPSLDLLPRFDDDFRLEERWEIDGTHYGRTARAWRENLEARRDEAMSVLEETYGEDADRWYQRWRLFFLGCEELFDFQRGSEWLVAHYRFAPRQHS
ncbi:MAG: cyclopropane-fatty-acyl-phospholipid synthase family protein [Gemmatimonadota bacterium]